MRAALLHTKVERMKKRNRSGPPGTIRCACHQCGHSQWLPFGADVPHHRCSLVGWWIRRPMLSVWRRAEHLMFAGC